MENIKSDIKNFIISNIGSIALIVMIFLAFQSYKKSLQLDNERQIKTLETLSEIKRLELIDSVMTAENKSKIEGIIQEQKELKKRVLKVDKLIQQNNEETKKLLDDINSLDTDLPRY